MHSSVTNGIHHIGLTVSKLEQTADFFTRLLGWKEIKRRDDYPAIFVSDGTIMLTLWAIREEPATAFDKNRNVGLHHIAFRVVDQATLHTIHAVLEQAGVAIEFAPELLGPGPAMHMMCYEPSGIRVEIIWPGQAA